jgi:hypothetical protein
MLDKNLHVVGNVISVSNYYITSITLLKIGTIIGSSSCYGHFSLFQIKVISLWISQRNVLPPALTTSPII